MALVAVGLSHKTAPIELRENLALPPDKIPSALERLLALGDLSEAVILSTCNRVEVYARPLPNRSASEGIARFLGELYGHPGVATALYRLESGDAVRHLFRVASGLDSLVVGEGEILGQVKSAYLMAQKLGRTGKITNVLFQRALYVGKQVRTKTSIAEGASSIGAVAVQLAERIFGALENHRLLLIGAGKMAEVTARHLLSQKVTDIVVLNRTVAKAEELAKLLNGSGGALDRLEVELFRSDIVICSASVEQPLITRDMVEPVVRARRGRSLYFVDIGVPRNVAAGVHQLDNAYVYNIDDLRGLVTENLERRHGSVATAEEMVRRMADEFERWISAAVEGRNMALRHGEVPAPSSRDES